MDWRVALILVAAVACGVAAWIAYPWTKRQCEEFAVSRVTQIGVRWAGEICSDRFPAQK